MAGRTDSGVHALGQVVNFKSPGSIPEDRWAYALNTVLPGDVRVLSSKRVDSSFHSRFDAVSRKYLYRILNRKEESALRKRTVWHVPQTLDLESMRKCLQDVEGLRDFSSFMNAGSGRTHALCHVHETGLRRVDDEVHIEITARSFVYRMIRNLVGALVEVGSGRMTAEEFRAILEARDRRKAPMAAPPQGLYFVEVKY